MGLTCTTREPNPWTGCRFEAEASEADVTCTYCEVEVEEGRAHLLRGHAFCPSCALDETARLRTDAVAWKALDPAQQLEVVEVMGAAAGDVESAMRLAIRTTGAL